MKNTLLMKNMKLYQYYTTAPHSGWNRAYVAKVEYTGEDLSLDNGRRDTALATFKKSMTKLQGSELHPCNVIYYSETTLEFRFWIYGPPSKNLEPYFVYKGYKWVINGL